MIYTFKEVLEDGVAPDRAMFHQGCMVYKSVTGDQYLIATSDSKKGDKVLCSISIDDLDEVKQMKERIAYLEQMLCRLGHGELV